MKAKYVSENDLLDVYPKLPFKYRLIVSIAFYTGLRISDILNLKTKQISRKQFKIRELKTNKEKSVYLADPLRGDILSQAGEFYCFESRKGYNYHLSRQAVSKAIKKATDGKWSIHSLRKNYAVRKLKGDIINLAKVQKLLNHDSPSTTVIYALSNLF
jgi:integrase